MGIFKLFPTKHYKGGWFWGGGGGLGGLLTFLLYGWLGITVLTRFILSHFLIQSVKLP